jgi:5-methylcytosine-specific restriction endonuclease McrA
VGQVFRSPSIKMRVPKVIALDAYCPTNAAPKFCRRSILLRDRFRGQYYGERFPSAELTFDHVVPHSAVGQTVWENILSAYVECNKRNQPANWSGRKGDGLWPLNPPQQPTML